MEISILLVGKEVEEQYPIMLMQLTVVDLLLVEQEEMEEEVKVLVAMELTEPSPAAVVAGAVLTVVMVEMVQMDS
jgi:hypothetical protein